MSERKFCISVPTKIQIEVELASSYLVHALEQVPCA